MSKRDFAQITGVEVGSVCLSTYTLKTSMRNSTGKSSNTALNLIALWDIFFGRYE